MFDKFRRRTIGLLGSGMVFASAFALAMPIAATSTSVAAHELRIVMEREPQDLDPGNTDNRDNGMINYNNVLEGLVSFDTKTGEITPRLATEWERTGETTWRFTLREGVTFHDGEPFNADAVIAGIERLFTPEVEQMNRSRHFQQTNLTVEKVDDYIVDISSDTFEPLFELKVSQVMIPSPNTTRERISREPIGTGPFRFAGWDAGSQIVLERNDDYWGDQPETTRATFYWRSEASVRANMVAVGEADITLTIDEEAATNPATDQGVYSFQVLYYIIGAWEPPLDDVRVREAINLSIDREAMVGTILPAASMPATALMGPFTFGHNPDLEPHPYDPERARALLDEARADGVDVDARIQVLGLQGHFPRSDEVLEAVAAMLAMTGFNVVHRTLETGLFRSYRDKPRVEDGPVLLQANHENSTGDAGVTFSRHRCDTIRNPICDERIDELLDQGLGAEGDERLATWQELARYMHEEVHVDGLIAHRVDFVRKAERINYEHDGRPKSRFFIEEVTFNE